MTCNFFRIGHAVTVDGVPLGTSMTLDRCGRDAHYRDSIGRPLCADCASEVQRVEEGDVVFGPAGKRLLIAPVH